MARKITLGKVYRIEDPSHRAHFGMPYKAYKKKKKYNVYMFTSQKKKSYDLLENIDPEANKDLKSYVRKRPERVGETYIKKEYPNYSVRNVRDKKILRHVRKNKIKIRGK